MPKTERNNQAFNAPNLFRALMDASNQPLLHTLATRLGITRGSHNAFDLEDASARAWEYASRNVHFNPMHVSALGFIARDIRWRYSALKSTAWDKRTRHAYQQGTDDRTQRLSGLELALQQFNAEQDDTEERELVATQLERWQATAIAIIGATRYARLVAYEDGHDRSVRTCQWACRTRALLRKRYFAGARAPLMAEPSSPLPSGLSTTQGFHRSPTKEATTMAAHLRSVHRHRSPLPSPDLRDTHGRN